MLYTGKSADGSHILVSTLNQYGVNCIVTGDIFDNCKQISDTVQCVTRWSSLTISDITDAVKLQTLRQHLGGFLLLICVFQRSAQYLHKELPVRIAHRIAGFRGLPFIVGCNPTILSVVSLSIRTHMYNHWFIVRQICYKMPISPLCKASNYYIGHL